MLIKFAVVVALGAPAMVVLILEVLVNATSMFQTANVLLTISADRILRWIVVTPEMHRVHHSILRHETTATSASTYLGGIAGSGPTAPSPGPGTAG